MTSLYCNVFIDTEKKENEKKKIVLLLCLHLLKDSCMNFWCILYHIHASNEEHLFIYKVRVAVNSTRKKIVELNKDMLFCNEKDCNSRFFF